MKTSSSKILMMLVAAIAVAGCKGKASKRTEHSGPRATDLADDTVSAKDTNVVMTTFKDRQAITDRINGAKTAADALAVATELKGTVLDTGVLNDPEFSGRSEFDAVLSLFHRSIDKAMDLDLSYVEKSGILAEYETVVLSNCTVDLTGCTYLSIFKGDHLSARLLMRIAKTLETQIASTRQARTAAAKGESFDKAQSSYFAVVQRYYRLLNLAYELSTSQANPVLDQMYVNSARDYFEYFRKLPEQYKRPDLHRRFRDTMTMALGHLRNQTRAASGLNEQYCSFLMALNPLNPEMFTTMDLDKRSRRSMLDEFVKCAEDKGELAQLIQAEVRKQNDLIKVNYANDAKEIPERYKVQSQGYAYALKSLEETPFFYNNLDVKLTPRDDMAFFIADSVFYQRMELAAAQTYWNRIKGLNELDFMKFMHNYARVQTAYVLQVTMRNYGKIFSERYKKMGGLSSDFFYEVAKEVNDTSQFAWVELRDRLAFMKEFITKIYDGKLAQSVGEGSKELQKEYLSLKQDLNNDNLNDHFAMAVTTPMSIPLYYYMAKAQGTIKFLVPWVTSSSNQWFDVPAQDALAQFLTPYSMGSFPFFKFASNNQALDEYQKLHVLDYALRIGVFEFIDFGLLDEDKAKNQPSEVLFFQQAIKDILKNFEYSFTNQIEKLRIEAAGSNFKGLMSACQDPLSIANSLDLRDLPMQTLLKSDSAIVQPLSTIYQADGFIGAYRAYRDGILQLVKVMEKHFDGKNADARLTPAKLAARKQIAATVRAEVERFNSFERQMFAEVLSIDKQIVNKERDCLARMTKAETFRRNKVLADNVEFYKDVHAGMTLARELDGKAFSTADAGLAIFKSLAASKGLEADVIARAEALMIKIRESALLATMDIFGAVNAVLAVHNNDAPNYKNIGFFIEGLPTLSASGKPVKTINKIDRDYYWQGRWDSLLRTRHYLMNHIIDPAEANAALGIATYTKPMRLTPNLRVGLGTFGELEVKDDYTTNTGPSVAFSVKQAEFVKDAMVQYAGAGAGAQFVSWLSPGGLSIALSEQRLNWKKKLMDLDVIETADTDPEKCPKDQWGKILAVKDIDGRWLPGAPHVEECKAIKVSAKDVMDSYRTALDLLRVSEEDRKFMNLTERLTRMTDRITYYLKYNSEKSTLKWTYFDQFYRTNYTSVQVMSRNGREWKPVILEDIRGRRDFIRFRDSYLANVDRSTALFPPTAPPTQVARDSIREQIVKHLGEITEFEETVYALENTRVDLGDFLIERTTTAEEGEPLVFGDWRVMPVRERQTGERKGTPIYLEENSNSAKDWFSRYVNTFVTKDTDCFVLPTKDDPDFTKELTGTCRDKLQQWQAERNQNRLKIREELAPKTRGGV